MCDVKTLCETYIQYYATLEESFMKFGSFVVKMEEMDSEKIEYGMQCVRVLEAMYNITENYSGALIKANPFIEKLMKREVMIYEIFESLGCF